ncbi:Uncharacterised protein [Trueperella bialowiezensis]|uniref:Uncharacterized protein n=2 Tax=Trueperella bialowiezensis TaxID=312285 RepID=A0A3S4VAC3_9ACTO|nr:Uncharacterised protein [Trueperella bialowiezensis]
MTLREVPEKMGTDASAVYRFETGQHDPHLSTVRRYAIAVGAEIDTPTGENPENRANLTFFPMTKDRDDNGQLPGVAASLSVTLYADDWLLGAVSQVFLISDEARPMSRKDEDTWVQTIVDLYQERTCALLWDIASSALKSTAGMMKLLPVEVPDLTSTEINVGTVPAAERNGR